MSKPFYPVITTGESPGELAAISNAAGWMLRAFRIDFHTENMEFIQFEHPDGTSSYMRLDEDGTFRAGPFGGGYSWALPKYVIEAGRKLALETFVPSCKEAIDAG